MNGAPPWPPNPPADDRTRPAGPALLAAYHGAFHGSPADGLAALGEPTAFGDRAGPAGSGPYARWLAGVCLGAQGRYRLAARMLCPVGTEPTSLGASTMASHLRQLGRHADAEPLDTLAVALSAAAPWPDVALADALVGLVADAVGRTDADLAATRLDTAREHVAALDPRRHWRALVRLDWVAAEHAMLCGEPEPAHAYAVAAVRRSRTAAAPRHRAKSLLVLGVAGHMLGRSDAIRVLAAAAGRAERLGVPTLVWPARLVQAAALSPTDPDASRLARARGDAVLRAIAEELGPADGGKLLAAQGTAPA